MSDAGEGKGKKGKSKGKSKNGKKSKKSRDDLASNAAPDESLERGSSIGKGDKGAKGKKGKGQGQKGNVEENKVAPKSPSAREAKRMKEKTEAEEDEDIVPLLRDRQVIQGQMDPAKLELLRTAAQKERNAVKAQSDPALLPRRYKCVVTVNAIQNMTSFPWEVFFAVAMQKTGSFRRDQKVKGSYAYSKMYKVAPDEVFHLKKPEIVYQKMYEGSYKDLQGQELRMDLWLIVQGNFNQHLGLCLKTLYAMANDKVSQQLMVKGFKEGSHMAFDLGVVHISGMVSEIFQFNISLSNWQFQPARADDFVSSKSLRFKVPTGQGKICESFSTPSKPPPRYSWDRCGTFVYVGTKVGLTTEAMTIEVLKGDVEQGKSVVSLGSAGDYPVATGIVKALTNDLGKFYQGRVGGGIALKVKSLLLPADAIDDDPSVPPPEQPASNLMIYHLDPSTQYLLVDVSSAEALPIADSDHGSSNPFVRVRYDGIVQQSPVLEGTLRPVFNHTFYLPVRYTDEKIRFDSKYAQSLLPKEIESKGYLELELWHFDGVPTEFLGGFQLDLRNTRFGEDIVRSVCEKASKVTKVDSAGDEIEEKEDKDFGINPKLTKKQNTKLYSARKPLTGTQLAAQTIPKITFSCCFLPDFPDSFSFPAQKEDTGAGQIFAPGLAAFDESWDEFSNLYMGWYPDAPKQRRFISSFVDPKGTTLPLPILVQGLALPISLAQPSQVLHWVRCLEFIVPTKQKSKGQFTSWSTPESILAMRRGTPQDHAVLLVCALLGLRKDAYVCKGTLKGNVEHAWAMTREREGTVTFWEPTTGAKYHLPKRWCGTTARPKMKQTCAARWKSRSIFPDWKEEALQRLEVGRRQQVKDMDILSELPFSPWKQLVDRTTVVPLPYESIEIVFGPTQLWGNLGNHHPSCIFYDFEEDKRSWKELLGQEEINAVLKERGVTIPIGPAISKLTADQLEANIAAEVRESIRMTRVRKGFESLFDENVTLNDVLKTYLVMLEHEVQLDIDWQHDQNGKPVKAPGYPSPINSAEYINTCKEAWVKWWGQRAQLDKAKIFLPVKTNFRLSGVPFHFSGSDIRSIRHHLLDCKAVQEYIAWSSDSALYFVCVKVVAMAASVTSVWVWVGMQLEMTQDEIFEVMDQLERDKLAGKGTNSVGTDADKLGLFGAGEDKKEGSKIPTE